MHQRFPTSIRIEYRVQIPESPEVSWIGYGVLKNVSFSGVYFQSSDTPPIEQGQIRNFTIMSADSHSNFSNTAYISSKGRVVRIEPPKQGLMILESHLSSFRDRFLATLVITSEYISLPRLSGFA